MLRSSNLRAGEESDDLRSKHIETRANVLGHGDGPRSLLAVHLIRRRAFLRFDLVIRLEEFVRTPVPILVFWASRAYQAQLGNLEPAQVFLLGLIAWAAAVRHVVDHWATMIRRPAIPVELDLTTSGNLGVKSSGLGDLVTDDVWVSVVVFITSDKEALSRSFDIRPPADAIRIWGLPHGLFVTVATISTGFSKEAGISRVLLAIDVARLNGAMSGGTNHEGEDTKKDGAFSNGHDDSLTRQRVLKEDQGRLGESTSSAR